MPSSPMNTGITDYLTNWNRYFIKMSNVYSSEIFTFYGHVELQ